MTRTTWIHFVPRQLLVRGAASIGGTVLFVVALMATRNPAVLAAAVAIAALGNAWPSAPIAVPPSGQFPPRAAAPEVAAVVQAATGYLQGSRWRAFVVNALSNVGLWAGVALLVAWASDLSPGRRAVIAVAFALPAAVALWASIAAIGAVLRGEATEFEAHLLTRSAALTLGALLLLGLAYGVAELVFSAPDLSAWWFLAAVFVVWPVSLQLLRRRMSG